VLPTLWPGGLVLRLSRPGDKCLAGMEPRQRGRSGRSFGQLPRAPTRDALGKLFYAENSPLSKRELLQANP
jgi:hypothetical protein